MKRKLENPFRNLNGIMTIDSLREGSNFEAKLADGGLPRSLWETYSAFANTDGGIIVLGVKEDKGGRLRIVGVNNPESLVKQFWDTINNESKVNANILLSGDVSVEEADGKRIVKIRVPRAERFERPIYLNGNILTRSYRRNGEGDYRCSKEEIRAMLRDAEAKSQDSTIVEGSDISSLDLEALHSYRNRMRLARPGHVWETLPDDMFMFRLGAMARDKSGNLRPTRAGLLMFGFEYEIVREFPVYFLDYREKFDADTRWTDRIYSSSGDWNGGVYDFYFRVYNRIAQTLKTPFRMVGAERIDDTPVHQAVREALLNCLANADYYQPRGVVVIRDKESLSLSNPGGFRVPIKTAMSGGVSDPRNATILKMFSLIDIGERTGSGIPKIRKTCADMHWPDIAISEEFNPERTITLVALPYNATPEKLDIGVKKPDIGGGKLDIGGEKPDLRAELEGIRLSAPTKCNIERLIANIALEEVFGRARVEEILDLSHGAASNLLRVMKERYLIEAVKGQGKGKYRFANQFRRES